MACLQFGQHVVGDGLHVGGAVLDGQAVDVGLTICTKGNGRAIVVVGLGVPTVDVMDVEAIQNDVLHGAAAGSDGYGTAALLLVGSRIVVVDAVVRQFQIVEFPVADPGDF